MLLLKIRKIPQNDETNPLSIWNFTLGRAPC